MRITQRNIYEMKNDNGGCTLLLNDQHVCAMSEINICRMAGGVTNFSAGVFIR